MKRLLILAVMVLSLWAHAQTKIPDTQITGTVTDQDGGPVSAVTVYAVPQFAAIEGISPRSAKTDGNGDFDFHGGLAYGTYKLYARNDKDAYPDPFDVFYADYQSDPPEVDISENRPSAKAKVKVAKAGTIEGRVLDAVTGRPVPAARVMFLDNDGNGHAVYSASGDGKYRALLPTGKDLTVMVRLTASASDRMQFPVMPMRLEAGDQIYLDLIVSKY